MENREVMFFLQSVSGIGKKSIAKLWEVFQTAEAIYNASEKELADVLRPSQIRIFLQERERKNPKDELEKWHKKGVLYYSRFDEGFPKRLLKTSDCPDGLFVRGELPPQNTLTISIVGTRRHSYYGEKQTRKFASLIAKNKIPIISGMAKGIDGIAHKTALDNGGKTYAVLGCGVNVCYPPENYGLFEAIPEQGGIISEYYPTTKPTAGLFPVRNRIISGLGDVLLVMEAREKSGTLITVDMALEQGKEIWVLPGRVDDALSAGCNRLIAQGAGMLLSVSEFEKEIALLSEKYGKEEGTYMEQQNTESDGNQYAKLTVLEKIVAAVLDYQPLSLNGIYERLDKESRLTYSIQQVSVTLIQLCMKQMAKQTGTGYYMRS